MKFLGENITRRKYFSLRTVSILFIKNRPPQKSHTCTSFMYRYTFTISLDMRPPLKTKTRKSCGKTVSRSTCPTELVHLYVSHLSNCRLMKWTDVCRAHSTPRVTHPATAHARRRAPLPRDHVARWPLRLPFTSQRASSPRRRRRRRRSGAAC